LNSGKNKSEFEQWFRSLQKRTRESVSSDKYDRGDAGAIPRVQTVHGAAAECAHLPFEGSMNNVIEALIARSVPIEDF
jgi:hypothetical protein